jgi:hypothetical protein
LKLRLQIYKNILGSQQTEPKEQKLCEYTFIRLIHAYIFGEMSDFIGKIKRFA